MPANQKTKLKDWYRKIDPPMWLAADFECRNVSVKSTEDDKFMENCLFTNSCNRL